ncbi:cytochrome P450 [Microbispora sp. ZYX-F-249]|uniref:Cytochrome P450 n=1 Tax=Microbispora maris TaxID=3144104 RepID=A0ABV0AZ70_9ACTN
MPPIEQLAGPRELVAALVTPEGRQNPYPVYEELRAHGDLLHIRPGLMMALGYAEISHALRSPRLRVQDARSYDVVHPGWRSHASLRGYTDSMLYTNPPDHARLRRLVSKGFSPARVAALRPAIERVTGRLLDRMAGLAAGGTPVDFIAEFASRLPIAVISELLGVPEDDQAWFRRVAKDLTIALEGITNVSRIGVADAAMDELSAYFDELIGRSRREPRDDIVGALVRAHDDGDRLTHDELVGNLMLLLTAGFETTSFLLGHALRLALEQPRHAARLRGEPGFVTGYVEEVLRFESPVQATSRWAETDVDVLGTTVPAGTKLVLVLAAGNRDPRRYTDPGRFDPDRPDVQPLSFGAGAHFCLGAPLSRMEAQIALPTLLRRFPRIAAAEPPTRRDRWVGRGLERFPIVLE